MLSVKRATLFICLLLSACSSYEFYLNEQAIYTPPKLFTDYHIPDASLEACIKQTIHEKKITQAKGLQMLNCSSAGITSLEGLQIFKALERLNLANNSLRSVKGLAQLPQLKELKLDKNPELNCADKDLIATAVTLTLPAHCL